MSRYAVRWLEDAENELADIWLNAPDRRAITTAQAAVDRLLAASPMSQGIELAEGLRRLTVAPLTVFYSIRQAERLVEVAKVTWRPS